MTMTTATAIRGENTMFRHRRGLTGTHRRRQHTTNLLSMNGYRRRVRPAVADIGTGMANIAPTHAIVPHMWGRDGSGNSLLHCCWFQETRQRHDEQCRMLLIVRNMPGKAHRLR